MEKVRLCLHLSSYITWESLGSRSKLMSTDENKIGMMCLRRCGEDDLIKLHYRLYYSKFFIYVIVDRYFLFLKKNSY